MTAPSDLSRLVGELRGKITPGPWRHSESWRPAINRSAYKPEDIDPQGNVFWGYSVSGSSEHGGPILPTLAAVHNFPDQIAANAQAIALVPALLTEHDRLTAENASLAQHLGAVVRALEEIKSQRIIIAEGMYGMENPGKYERALDRAFDAAKQTARATLDALPPEIRKRIAG